MTSRVLLPVLLILLALSVTLVATTHGADGKKSLIKVSLKKPGGRTPAGESVTVKVKLKNREEIARHVQLELSFDEDYSEICGQQAVDLLGRERRTVFVSCAVPADVRERKIRLWARAGDGSDRTKVKVEPVPMSGQDLYTASCATCHGATGSDIRDDDFGDWKEAVREGDDGMPAFPGFSKDDIRRMRNYIRDLDPGGSSGVSDEDWLRGKEVYTTSCASCHGARGNDIRHEDLDDWLEAVREGEDDMPAMPGISATDVELARAFVLDPDRVVDDPAPDPDPDPDPGPGPITYIDDVKSILDTSCVSCHRQGLALGGIALDTYAQAYAHRAVTVDSVEKNRMPTAGPLSATIKQLLRDWLDGGAPEK